MILKRLLKFLFTWWNGSTVGTDLYTFLYGTKVGEDYFGNSYYESKNKKKIDGASILISQRLQKSVLNGTVGYDFYLIKHQEVMMLFMNGKNFLMAM